MEMADSLQFSAFDSLALYFVHSDGLVSTVGNNYESARLVNANSSAGVHSGWESTWNCANGLN